MIKVKPKNEGPKGAKNKVKNKYSINFIVLKDTITYINYI